VFPIIRRLMSRLEVQRGVQRFGEGDLAARVPVQGHDEVADLVAPVQCRGGAHRSAAGSHKSLLANASHELRSPLARASAWAWN
jgi:signal transduction histidine kinase